ncbi:NINE protein [Gordonia oryzae]|nr:TM2 domain-containing protein [Gordonia oryzae]
MSYQQYPGHSGQGQSYGAGQPGYGSQPYGVPPGQSPYLGYGGVPGYGDFNVDPVTGEPLSDKSKLAAGLLQLFLGGFAAGRFYIGDMKLAVIQLGGHLAGWLLVIVGFIVVAAGANSNSSGGAAFGGIMLLVGSLVILGFGIWVLVDAIMMLAGSVRDPQGRKLRS